MGTHKTKLITSSRWGMTCLFVVLCTNLAGASTLNVPEQFTTIRAAVDAALPGDIVQLADGTYTGIGNRDIEIINKNITIRGNPDRPELCIIDCQDEFMLPHRGFVYGFNVTPDSRLDGLTITGGNQQYGSGIIIYGSPVIANCIFSGNSADYGAGMMIYGSPAIINCTFTDNLATWGGAIIVFDGSPVFDKCILTSNSASSWGGGICLMGGTPIIGNCTFAGNTSDMGAGIYVGFCDPKITNCTFWDNTAGWGGGICAEYVSTIAAINCTFSRNKATGDGGHTPSGGAIYLGDSTADLSNCILWSDSGDEIASFDTNSVKIKHSIVRGGNAGEGNINADPLFVDDNAGNLRLKPNSLCVDAGDNSVVNAPPFKVVDGAIVDLDGNPRIMNDTVDIGAYEVTNMDTTPPVLNMPGNITVKAAGPAGAVVRYDVTAVDNVDGDIAVTCSPASGSRFPLGKTTVNCSATDASGNNTTGSFTVTVQYAFGGFLRPINSDGSSIFKQGSVIPVKFQLPNPKGGFISNAIARIYVTKLADGVSSGKHRVVPKCHVVKGNLFRYDRRSNQYIYILDTRAMTPGTWLIGVDLGDGNPDNTASITIKQPCPKHR